MQTDDDTWLEALRDPLPALAILAGLRLDLFTALSRQPRGAVELAAERGWDARRLEPLLHALTALEMLTPLADGSGRFACAPAAVRRLSADSPEFDGHEAELTARLWAAGLTVAESIRLGGPTAPKAAGAGGEAELAAFLRGLHPAAVATGDRLGRQGWLAGCRRVVDVGAGSGGLCLGLGPHLPAAERIALERPDVAPVTRRFLAEAGDTAARVVEGDLVADGAELEAALDGPVDGVVACALLQVLGPEAAAAAVGRMAGWLAPGGRLLVLGMGVVDDDRAAPRDAALHGILFGTLYDEGRAHSVTEYRSWMADAGLVALEHRWLEDGRGAVLGRRP